MKRSILIVGAGIAGLTLADWLERFGWQVTVIEKAPRLQTGGYMIDFFGPGFAVAEKMGILPRLNARHFPVAEMRFVNSQGTQVSSVSIDKLRAKAKNRHVNFLRGDLEETLNEHVRNRIPIRYGITITAVAESDRGAVVTYSDGSINTFAAVVGADGLHSTVRELVFGPMPTFERYLGYANFAYIIPPVATSARAMIAYLAPDRLSIIYPIAGHRMAASFVFRASAKLPFLARPEQIKLFHETFTRLPAPIARAAAAIDTVPEIYFGPFSQIRAPVWHRGRVALVGDAAYCVSPLAGQGASLAMYGAYVLAQAFKENDGSVAEAFSRYEAKARPEVILQQKKAERLARLFLPKSRLGAAVASRLAPLFLLSAFKSTSDEELF